MKAAQKDGVINSQDVLTILVADKEVRTSNILLRCYFVKLTFDLSESIELCETALIFTSSVIFSAFGGEK